MEHYSSAPEYDAAVRERSQLPAGFRVGRTVLQFFPSERDSPQPYSMNLSLLLLDEPTPSFAGVFTQNSFAGYPVLIGRQRLDQPLTRGVIVNNRIANVGCVDGDRDAERILTVLADAFDADPEDFFPASTGIIGWKLPVEEIVQSLPGLVSRSTDRSFDQFARAIMTTDRYPKVRRVAVGEGSIVAVAKGAGMIEPNLATMLCFVATDVTIDRRMLQQLLGRAADASFNRISVDSDQSTSDMILAFSSRKRPEVAPELFERALTELLGSLAEDVVRNGEGTSHVIHAAVGSAESVWEARAVAKAIVNSPLVKTAIFGNDPNVGRILAAAGDLLGNEGKELDLSKVRATLGGRVVYSEGRFRLDFDVESALSAYLREAQFDPKVKGFPFHDRKVEIELELGRGRASGEALGSDLSYDYVRENADYRT